MQDTSSIGVKLRIKASITFPQGITVTAFPEDNDTGSSGEVEIGQHASGVNGDLITWKVVNAIGVQVPVIPNTQDEALLNILYNANRASKNRMPVKDIITITSTNPVTGVTTTYKNGVIENGNPNYTYGGDGRIKSKVYTFTFEDVI